MYQVPTIIDSLAHKVVVLILSVVADVAVRPPHASGERTVMQDADLGGSKELRSSLDIFTY